MASSINEGRFFRRGSEEENLKPKKRFNPFNRKTEEKKKEETITVDLSILTDEDKLVYNAMEKGKMMTEDSFLNLGLSVADISAALLNLEIYGLIEAKPGGFYVKK